MARDVNSPGARLAGLIADLGQKLQKGGLTEEQLEHFLNKQNPFNIIRVCRSFRPAYPTWIPPAQLNDPEFIRLEATGPSEYWFDSLQLSLHPKQEQGFVTGNEVYAYQKELGLEDCLGLADLLVIQSLDFKTIRRRFVGAVSGWKSTVPDDKGELFVPCLFRVSFPPFFFFFQ